MADGPLASLKGDGKLELREAVELATHPNESVDGFTISAATLNNTIQFDSSLDGKTINLLGAGESSFGGSAFAIGSGGTLTIDGETGLSRGITIARPQTFSTTIGGTVYTANVPAFRLANVGSTSGLTLEGLTISGFAANGFTGGGGDSMSTGGGSAGLGGAIFSQGSLTIFDSTLTGNTAQGGAGGSVQYAYVTYADHSTERYIAHSGSGGAGLNGDGAAAVASVDDGGQGGGPNGGTGGVPLYPNGYDGGTGGGGGGGLGSNVSFDYGNGGAGGFGGGGGGGGEGDDVKGTPGANGGTGGFGGGGGGGAHVGLPEGGLSGVGGLFGGNANENLGGGGAGLGGAIFNWGGTVIITNSTLTGNAARGGAGGTTPASSLQGLPGVGGGGAVISLNGTTVITDSTISQNFADGGARGVVIYGYTGLAKAAFNDTIIGQSNNSRYAFDLLVGATDGAAIIGGQGNLIGNGLVDETDSTNDLVGTLSGDPKLGPLQDNGGLTPTLAPLPGSPAIDAGQNAAVAAGLATDQRGDTRISNGTVDIGAVETHSHQTINFAPLANRTYGDADFAISATSSSNLSVGFTATGNATVYQSAGVWYVHIIGAGTATVTATQPGNADYDAASPVVQYFTIARAGSATTTAGSGPFVYNGTAQAGGSGTVTGIGGLSTGATSLTYSANADGTGAADLTNAGTYYVTAHYAGDANHTASDGAAVAINIGKAAATVNVTGYSGVYDGAYHGATGTATGVGGASVGTLNLGATFINVPGGTAHWTFDGGRNYLSQQGDVAVQILARHVTGTFTVASKVYDGTTSATVTSRSLVGVVGTDAVGLTGGTATFASKNAGTRTVTLVGATLTGAASGNYVLDSVATATANIVPKAVKGAAATLPVTNVAMNGILPFVIVPNRGDIVDGQTVAQLFDGATVSLSVGGRTYSVRPRAIAVAGVIEVNFTMTAELKAILAANTTATNGGNAQTVAINLTATSKDGNYSLNATAMTKLFNTSK